MLLDIIINALVFETLIMLKGNPGAHPIFFTVTEDISIPPEDFRN